MPENKPKQAGMSVRTFAMLVVGGIIGLLINISLRLIDIEAHIESRLSAIEQKIGISHGK